MTSSGWPTSGSGGSGPTPGWGSGQGVPGQGAAAPGNNTSGAGGWQGAQSASGPGGGSGWQSAGSAGQAAPQVFSGNDWTSQGQAVEPSTWTPAGGDDRVAARPPMVWLWAAIAGPVIGAALLLLHGWGWNVAGWAAAVVVGLGLLVVFTTVDLRRRLNPWYLARPGIVSALRLGVAVLAIAVAGVHAYLLADDIARLDMWA